MATGSPASGTGSRAGTAADPRGERYKWVALSNTTLGMLVAIVFPLVLAFPRPQKAAP